MKHGSSKFDRDNSFLDKLLAHQLKLMNKALKQEAPRINISFYFYYNFGQLPSFMQNLNYIF